MLIDSASWIFSDEYAIGITYLDGTIDALVEEYDVTAIYNAIQNAYAKKGVPSCIVLDTCKGKGATFAEPKHDHSSQPNEEQWAEALAAAEKAYEDAKNA